MTSSTLPIGNEIGHEPARLWWNSRSSTLRSDSGKRTCMSTTSRITSGDELKQRNALAGMRERGLPYPPAAIFPGGAPVLTMSFKTLKENRFTN